MTRDEMIAKLQRVSDRLEYLPAADLRGDLADALAALSTPAPVSGQSIAHRLVEWHDARYVQNLGEPFSAIVDDARREIATPAPVAAPPADLVALVKRAMNAYTRELEARNAWVASAPQSRESFELFEVVQAREADTRAAFLALLAFPLPEVPDGK